MKEYRIDIGKVHVKLSREEQKKLYLKMQEGDEYARDSVIHSCLPLVVDIASKFRINNKHVDLEDMIQEGNIALIAAVDNWDAERAAITTVATWYIKNTLIDMIHDAKYKIKNPLSLSRRAAEELSKIKRQGTNDIEEISNRTNMTKKRIKKLLSVDPKQRFSTIELSSVLEAEEQSQNKPCMADLELLVSNVLDDPAKDIFVRWSGMLGKKQGVTKISEDLNLTIKETMSHLSSAKRQLKTQAKKEKESQDA
jgi:RNA polymerase sigma factor (sigma-70 family)